MSLLESMDVLLVQPALLEDELTAAPKKPRKVMLADPLIHHAVRAWRSPMDDPFTAQVRRAVDDPESASALVEACAVAHVARTRPTFHLKAAGEVDIAWVEGRRFHPVEVKWTSQLRPRDLEQIARCRNGTLWVKGTGRGAIAGVPTVPLALALLRFPAV